MRHEKLAGGKLRADLNELSRVAVDGRGRPVDAGALRRSIEALARRKDLLRARSPSAQAIIEHAERAEVSFDRAEIMRELESLMLR